MADNTQPIKLAAALPTPPGLSPQDLQRLDREASAWRAAVDQGTASLEKLTAEDLRIRLR